MKLITTTYRIELTDPANQPDHPVRIAMICDLHNAQFGPDQAYLADRIKKEHPAAVLSAGDLVTAKGGACRYDNALALIRRLAGICPMYLSQGNHELRMQEQTDLYGDAFANYRDAAEDAGARLLDNDLAKIRCAGLKLGIYGFSASLPNYKKLDKHPVSSRQLTETVGSPAPDRYNLLLAHHPAYLDAYAKWGADLVLAGHVHGGTVRLPLLGGLIGPDFRPLPRYDKGLYTKGKTQMAVGSGLGCHTIKLRINNPPELVIIELVPVKTE